MPAPSAGCTPGTKLAPRSRHGCRDLSSRRSPSLGGVSDPVMIAFVGHSDHDDAHRAAVYEDDVLQLLPDHGAHLLYRGRRSAGQDAELPAELHLIWFPSREAFESFLADPARQ